MTFFSFCIHFFNSCKSQVDVLVRGEGVYRTTAGIQSAHLGMNALVLKKKSCLSGNESPPVWQLLYIQSEYG